jgi:hypothetical protein
MGPRIDQTLCNADGVTIDDQDRQVPFYTPNIFFDEAPEPEETPLALAADMLAALFAEIIPKSGNIRLDLVGQKFVAMHYLLNRNGTSTLTSIAERSGVSKQLFDHHVQALGDRFGFHGQGQKCESSRTIFSEATKARWAALTPEERIARRAGKKAVPQATPVANLTICND